MTETSIDKTGVEPQAKEGDVVVDATENDTDNKSEEEEEGGQYFEIEKIMAEEVKDGQLFYVVRWLGYPPEEDTREPASELEHCVEIIAEWEAKKAERLKQKERKRSRSVRSGDESGSASGRTQKRTKTSKPKTSSKRTQEIVADDDDSDGTRGTADSYMNELKSKNEGTYAWEDVQPGKSGSISDSDDGSLTSLVQKERQRRKLKPKAKASTSKGKSPPKSLAKPITKPQLPSSKLSPHFPYMKLSMDSIKPAKRKPGETVNTVRPDDRRQKLLSYSHMNNIKKRQAQEPPPDTSAIALFRPNDILTNTAQTMKSGRGYEKAIGDIDTAISLSKAKDASPIVERRESIDEKPRPPKIPPGRRSSVTDALAVATKLKSETTLKPGEKSNSPIVDSPVKSPVEVFSDTMEDVDKTVLVDAWLKPGSISATEPRRMSFSGDSRPRSLPPRRNSSGSSKMSPETTTTDSFQPPVISILPILKEDAGRLWSGDLLYSKDHVSLGPIRLLIPQSSTRIEKLPIFSGSALHMQKLVSSQYLSKKWLSPSAHISKKPECLVVEFQTIQAQKTLVDILRNTDSAGLVLEKTCTLLFFFKHNDRLRPLFNVDTSPNPVGVALLQPVTISETITKGSRADELLSLRRMPYNGILLSENIASYIPHMKGLPYVLHSPAESLETDEIENILNTRGAVSTLHREKAQIVLIHRLYQPCLNYIPALTEHKRRSADIFLFGSYLDYEMRDCSVKPVFGSGMSRIFPNGGRICFTIGHLLENPQHIRNIIMYNTSRPTWKILLPISMNERLERLEQTGANNSENSRDILVALALLREQMAMKRAIVEDYRLDDAGVNSYMPFMNFLQHREYETVRRFVLIHPRPVSGGQWDAAGNGIEVYTPQEFDLIFKVSK